MILLIGIPVGFAFGMGWFSSPRAHLLPLVLGAILFVLIFIACLVVIGVVQVLVKDFVVPQMAFDNVSVGEGWRRLVSMMKSEKGGYAGYIGMKVVLSFAAAVMVFVAALVVFLVLLIPVGGFGDNSPGWTGRRTDMESAHHCDCDRRGRYCFECVDSPCGFDLRSSDRILPCVLHSLLCGTLSGVARGSEFSGVGPGRR